MAITSVRGSRLAGSPSAVVSGGTYSTYTSAGITYNVYTFTASGTLTVAAGGVVDVLVVGGGGGRGGSGSAAGGAGGGGNAGNPGTAGTANTGSGGGASRGSLSGNGGSGIVIIRYAV